MSSVNKYILGFRGEMDAKLGSPVAYTQAQHLSLTATIAFVLTQARMIGAFGRDKRNALEAKLLARIEALENRPSLKYTGIWNADTQNNEGEFVTHGGGVWYCKRATRQKPGSGGDWQLAVKSGERR